MAEGEQAAAAAAAATPAANATPWHTGVEAEMLGHWQNKGWKTDDPKEVAVAATKQARELERHFGVPADQLLKLPKADAKPDELAAFYQRLGAPKEPKEYDFSDIKFAGNDLEQSFADAMRASLAAAFVPKDRAGEIVKGVVKYLESADAAESAVTKAKIDAERADLKKNWGPNYDYNHLKAMEGARKLGITPEAVQALENQIGYAAVMDAMRKIGAGTSEDAFHEGGGGGGNPTTLAGAQALLNERLADKAWGKRLIDGDAATKAEWLALTTQIAAAA